MHLFSDCSAENDQERILRFTDDVEMTACCLEATVTSNHHAHMPTQARLLENTFTRVVIVMIYIPVNCHIQEFLESQEMEGADVV